MDQREAASWLLRSDLWPLRLVAGGVRRLHGGSIHHEHPPTVAAGQGGSLRANPVRQPPPYFLQPGQRQTRSGLAKGIGVRIEPPPPLPTPPCLSRPLGFPAGGARAEHHLQKHPENQRHRQPAHTPPSHFTQLLKQTSGQKSGHRLLQTVQRAVGRHLPAHLLHRSQLGAKLRKFGVTGVLHLTHLPSTCCKRNI